MKYSKNSWEEVMDICNNTTKLLQNLIKHFSRGGGVSIESLQEFPLILDSISILLNKLQPDMENEVVEEIDYDSLIEYFVDSRPNDHRVVKGALLKQSHNKGIQLTQVFLDNKNEVLCNAGGKPYGRKIIAKKIDDHLLEIFENEDLIIVE